MTDLTHARPYTPPNDPRLPKFASYEEEAAYWETHDFERLEPIPPEELAERQALQDAAAEERHEPGRLTEQLTVRLDHAMYAGIVAEAHEMGIGPSTLARMWLRERLRNTGRLADR